MGSDFLFPLSPVGKTLGDAIAREMTALFGITLEEAVGRINRHWVRHRS